MAEVAYAHRRVTELGILGQELQRLLAVVVDQHGLVNRARRQHDLTALLELLAEVRTAALPGARGELKLNSDY